MAEKDPVADDQLELKKRARRRLVGAVAIALAAVIVLPMVMDSEPRPAGQDIQVRIPSQEAEGFASRVLPGNKVLTTPLPQVGEVKSSPAESSPAPVAEKAGIVSPPATEKLPDVKPAPPSKSEVKPEVKPEPVKPAEAKPPAAKVAEKPAKPAEEIRAAAALEGKSAGQWVVQLGAYQNAGNVKLLLGKIKEMNIPAYTEKTETPQGARIRVRAGPFASKDAAEKAQVRIRKIGVDGPVSQK